jgi:hypothetical protein
LKHYPWGLVHIARFPDRFEPSREGQILETTRRGRYRSAANTRLSALMASQVSPQPARKGTLRHRQWRSPDPRDRRSPRKHGLGTERSASQECRSIRLLPPLLAK